MTKLTPTLVLLLTAATVACSQQGRITSSPTAPTAVLAEKPGRGTNISVTTIINDVDANGVAGDFASDGLGAYPDNVNGVTSFLTVNGYNGIPNGDWQFDTFAGTRKVAFSYDPDDAVLAGDPHYTVAANPLFWGTQAFPSHIEVKCTLLNRSMLTMPAGSSFTCPLVSRFTMPNGAVSGASPAYSFTGYPETTDVQVVCNSADSGGCKDWFINPIDLVGGAVARVNLPSSKPHGDPTNLGDFYWKFRIHVTRP